MGYNTTYRKAWLAKQQAIEDVYENWEQSYNILSCLLQAMQTYLSGLVYKLKTNPITNGEESLQSQQHFQRVFWTFKPCIDGFPFCKPIVQVDETFLYRRYMGTLPVAVAQDGTNNIFPIAFAVVEGETTKACFFFLKITRRHVTPQQNLCLMSVRDNSISATFNIPNSGYSEGNYVQVFCIRHIAQNFTKRFKNTTLKKDIVNMGKLLHVKNFLFHFSLVYYSPTLLENNLFLNLYL